MINTVVVRRPLFRGMSKLPRAMIPDIIFFLQPKPFAGPDQCHEDPISIEPDRTRSLKYTTSGCCRHEPPSGLIACYMPASSSYIPGSFLDGRFNPVERTRIMA